MKTLVVVDMQNDFVANVAETITFQRDAHSNNHVNSDKSKTYFSEHCISTL